MWKTWVQSLGWEDPLEKGTECLKELLKTKLIEFGWKDTVEGTPLRGNEQKGIQHVTVDDWVTEVTPKGRTQVPDCVKEELLGK